MRGLLLPCDLFIKSGGDDKSSEGKSGSLNIGQLSLEASDQ